jgi:hypothetical protein
LTKKLAQSKKAETLAIKGFLYFRCVCPVICGDLPLSEYYLSRYFDYAEVLKQ